MASKDELGPPRQELRTRTRNGVEEVWNPHVGSGKDNGPSPEDAAKGKALSGPTAGLAADEPGGTPETLHERASRVDTELAEIYRERAKNWARRESHMQALHRLAGDGKIQRFSDEWIMSEEEVLAAGPRDGYQKEWDKCLGEIRELERVDMELSEREQPLHREWKEAGRWSRFFLVLNNNGHIHSSMNCRTCNRGGQQTEFGWLPELSGLNESDAVEQQGEILCSECFPSAPVEWTNGTSKKDAVAKAERDAAKRAREETKLAKALMPDGEALWLPQNREPLKTERSASIWLTNHYEWEIAYNRDPDRYAEDEKLVVDALSAKTGETPEKIRATAKAKAQKKVDKYA